MVEEGQPPGVLVELLRRLLDGQAYLHVLGQVEHGPVAFEVDGDLHEAVGLCSHSLSGAGRRS